MPVIEIIPKNNLNNDKNIINILIKIKVSEIKDRSNFLIICVLDISGSMNDDASLKVNGEIMKLSIIDIAKHAVLTIANTLNDYDKFGIIVFSSNASILLEPIFMSDYGKIHVAEKLKNIFPSGSTNLKSGLELAIEQLNKYNEDDIMSHIMLLTDGQPNKGCNS